VYIVQARERFINLVVAAYWDELEEGKVSDRSFNMLRHATDVVRDKIRYHRTAPEEEEERSASGLSEWTTVEGLTVNHFLHFLMGALDHGPLKKIVHLRTAMYWDLVIDISTTFIDVHQKVLDEFKEGLSAIQKTDIATPRDYMRDTAITEGVIREAEFDLALAHRIFESVPHTSIIGRHSLTSICIRHIHKMCEKQCKKVFEEGELNESEFDLLMWGIARCESKHAWRMPGACAKEANLQLMLKKNLSKVRPRRPRLPRAHLLRCLTPPLIRMFARTLSRATAGDVRGSGALGAHDRSDSNRREAERLPGRSHLRAAQHPGRTLARR
jgi:hypothetical protein